MIYRAACLFWDFNNIRRRLKLVNISEIDNIYRWKSIEKSKWRHNDMHQKKKKKDSNQFQMSQYRN